MGEYMGIYFTEDDFIVNAMIEIHRKEGRRIIDEEEVLCYQKILGENFDDSGLSVIKRDGEYNQRFYEEMQVIERQGKRYYVMIPWIEEEELVENYRNLLPFSFLLSMMDPTISRKLLQKSEKELENMDAIYVSWLGEIYEDISSKEVHGVVRTKEKVKKLETIRRLQGQYE